MRVARAGYVRFALVVGAIVGLAMLGVTPAAAAPTQQAPTQQALAKHAFKVTIYPAYTTAGLPTTFEVTVANTSSPGTTLRGVSSAEAPRNPPGPALSSLVR